MERVSRTQAVSVLDELLGGATQLEKVPTISDIAINAHFDSALESRFIQSLSRLSGINGLPKTRLVQEIVKGKTGYLLEVDAQRYWIEPQVECPVNDGYAYASKPDFVLHPTSQAPSAGPLPCFVMAGPITTRVCRRMRVNGMPWWPAASTGFGRSPMTTSKGRWARKPRPIWNPR
jgi:DEAD/DEAH box helicase domain-containing protein